MLQNWEDQRMGNTLKDFTAENASKGPGSQGRFWIFITATHPDTLLYNTQRPIYSSSVRQQTRQTRNEGWKIHSWISHDGRAFIDCKDLFESICRITPRIREMPRSFGICKIVKQNRIISFIKGVFQHHFLYGGSHPYNYCLQNKTLEHSRKPNPLCRNCICIMLLANIRHQKRNNNRQTSRFTCH